MFLYALYREKNCAHPNICAATDYGYCPDCGEFIQNKWYFCRCSCCNIKRKSILKFNNIIPETKYCPNCGFRDFLVEELHNVNFININFAVLKKETQCRSALNFTPIQSWISIS